MGNVTFIISLNLAFRQKGSKMLITPNQGQFLIHHSSKKELIRRANFSNVNIEILKGENFPFQVKTPSVWKSALAVPEGLVGFDQYGEWLPATGHHLTAYYCSLSREVECKEKRVFNLLAPGTVQGMYILQVQFKGEHHDLEVRGGTKVFDPSQDRILLVAPGVMH